MFCAVPLGNLRNPRRRRAGAFALRIFRFVAARALHTGASVESANRLEPLCGADEYVLVHAAVEPRANQWIAMRAAAAIGAACVLVGTVENAEYYQSVIEAAGPGLIWLPQE